jgi:hypothetical protein
MVLSLTANETAALADRQGYILQVRGLLAWFTWLSGWLTVGRTVRAMHTYSS